MRSDGAGRRRPRTIDYVMWVLVAFTMVVVLRAASTFDHPIAWVVGMAYAALGALLMWRRWRSLSRR